MPAKLLMLQGTASSVGKSLLTAALCRILRQDGFSVAPFKAQNMSNNSYVTREGGEMGRAQVVQAQAAGIEPHVDMNPILLKPEAEARSQVVVLGRATESLPARAYYQRKAALRPVVLQALARLRARYEVVMIEGAGSPAEINLRSGDLVNMGLAREVDAPVLLVGDIDRGGVFAHLVGTMELLEPGDRALVRGTIINKFRGDPSLLGDALRLVERRTGVPVLGVVPFLPQHGVPEEDSVALNGGPNGRLDGGHGSGAAVAGAVDIAVVQPPRIANFTDFGALAAHPGVRLRYVATAAEFGEPHIVILPGSKSTVADLDYLRAQGLDLAVCRAAAAGRLVVGVCGGYQMLGERIRDPDGVESSQRETVGLGLLPVSTTFSPEKTTIQVSGRVAAARGVLAHAAGATVTGYEIHNGVTAAAPGVAPAFLVT
ncbi:MAG: cobyric acid synthase, partial [Chloroflexota bacterium]